MRFIEKVITLKDGSSLTLRSPNEADAEGMLAYLRKTAGETDHLLRTPEEVTLTKDEEKAYLRGVLDSPRSMMVCAFRGPEPIGCVSFRPVGDRQRVRHRAECGIALCRDFWGLGLGSLLMREMLREAGNASYEQMELTVYADNGRAIRLYERLGFRVWGRRLNACKMPDGDCRDDLLMGLLLKDFDTEWEWEGPYLGDVHPGAPSLGEAGRGL